MVIFWIYLVISWREANSSRNAGDGLENSNSRYRPVYRPMPFCLRFQGIIQRACEQTGERVVILVDEYDKPMLQAIGRPDLQESYRNTLKAFYGALKSKDGYIKFAMLTGVTKFGKVSVFSDLNGVRGSRIHTVQHFRCGLLMRQALQVVVMHLQ